MEVVLKRILGFWDLYPCWHRYKLYLHLSGLVAPRVTKPEEMELDFSSLSVVAPVEGSPGAGFCKCPKHFANQIKVGSRTVHRNIVIKYNKKVEK